MVATRVDGFRWAGVPAGIKRDGLPDLALLVADRPVAVAGLFTTNRVKAAPVVVSVERVEQGRAQAILVNSGNANACTGREGLDAARAMAQSAASSLGIHESLVLPASTGVIGAPLPVHKIQHAMPELTRALSPDGVESFARAILTTDRGPKIASVEVPIGAAKPATILGVAKGAGMIHPNVATTLVFLVTDAPMHSGFLQKALRQGADHTFNSLTVDGDTSTNDTLLALASSAINAEPVGGSGGEGRRFIDGVAEVLDQLGRMIVADGEGAEHLVTIEVVDAPSEDAARTVARTIATSTLVKTALFGKDPNWGRVLAAAGRAGVAFDPDRVELRFGDALVVKNGVGLGPGAEGQAREIMRQPAYTITVRLGAGSAQAKYLTCDLGSEYVRINAGYRS